MEKQTFYLAGPMSGYPQYNFPAFDAMTKRLREMGHDVISPADMDKDTGFDPTHEIPATEIPSFMRDCMTRDVNAIMRQATAIAVLPGWEKSSGCAVEIALARFLRLPVYDAETLTEITASNARGTTADDIPTKAVKFDSGKPMLELLSPWVLIEVGKVLTYGAKKYAKHNWRKGFEWTRPIGAALRHILAWLSGEDIDAESGLPHLAHAICCLMFTLEHQLLKMGVDDRWHKES